MLPVLGSPMSASALAPDSIVTPFHAERDP
jgi:hypothetical protein